VVVSERGPSGWPVVEFAGDERALVRMMVRCGYEDLVDYIA
jgi:hypothetical protein